MTPTLQELASEAAARYTAANPLSRTRFERSTGFLPGGDTRTVNHYTPFPVTIVHGAGSRLYDLDGHEIRRLSQRPHGRPLRALASGPPDRDRHRRAERPCTRRPHAEPAGFRRADLRALPLRRTRAVHELGHGGEPDGGEPRAGGHPTRGGSRVRWRLPRRPPELLRAGPAAQPPVPVDRRRIQRRGVGAVADRGAPGRTGLRARRAHAGRRRAAFPGRGPF